MKVLVAGATGAIGRPLVSALLATEERARNDEPKFVDLIRLRAERTAAA